MRKSVVILGVMALVMAGGTVYIVNNFLQAQKPAPRLTQATPQKIVKKTYVLVAASSLQPGAYLTANQVRWQAWPQGRISKTYITRLGKPSTQTDQRILALRNSVVRLPVPAGQPLTEEMIVSPGDRGFLAAVLKPGMRAVSININASSGVSGLAFPGDRVDLIWVYGIKANGGRSRDTVRVAETLLVGVRLLAVGQDLGHVEIETNPKGKGKGKKGGGNTSGRKIRRSTTATIELTPKQAEMIAVALTKGQITLSLNSLARPTDKKAHLITAANSDQTLKSGDGTGQPLRGRTFTMEQHVSRLISYVQRQKPSTQDVIVVRGGSSEKAGQVKKKNKAENPDDVEEEDSDKNK